MKKNIVITMFLTLISYLAFSQECGVGIVDSAAFVNRKWYGNMAYLDSVAKSIEVQVKKRKERESHKAVNYRGGTNNRLLQVPVKYWLYRTDDGLNQVDIAEVDWSLTLLNEYFEANNLEIHFYSLCDVTYINSSAMYDSPSNATLKNYWENYHVEGAINVHLIDRSNDWGGKANFPEGDNPFCMVMGVNNSNRNTMAHKQHFIQSAKKVDRSI